jgi:hypothetical protein
MVDDSGEKIQRISPVYSSARSYLTGPKSCPLRYWVR